MFTVRMFYNRQLWREIFGSETLPRTYEETVDGVLPPRRRVPHADGQPILPLAGAAQSNAPFLIQRLFSSQTQRLFYSLARPGRTVPQQRGTRPRLPLRQVGRPHSRRAGRPGDGTRGIGRFLPPGFLQLKREDALFLFSQGRALMTVTGSWDAPSLRSQAPFEVGVFDVPVPDGSDPRYGHNTVGRVSEAGTQTGLSFGMTKQNSAAKQAQVVDFLRFLTSRDSNRKFSEYSGWLPAVVGVQPSAGVRPFLPRMEGYPAGFNMGVSQGDNGGYNSARKPASWRYEYVPALRRRRRPGGVRPSAVAGPMRPAVIRDFEDVQRGQLEVVPARTRLSPPTAASSSTGGPPDDWAAKASELDELQTQEETPSRSGAGGSARLGVAPEK